MRQILIASAFAFFAFAQTSATAQERQYPWCARYDWTTSNCGFVSYNQCLATTSGVAPSSETLRTSLSTASGSLPPAKLLIASTEPLR